MITRLSVEMVREAIKQLKPKLVQIKQDTPVSIPPSFYSCAVMAVSRTGVINYLVKQHNLDPVVIIIELYQLGLDNEIALLTGIDGEKYIDASSSTK